VNTRAYLIIIIINIITNSIKLICVINKIIISNLSLIIIIRYCYFILLALESKSRPVAWSRKLTLWGRRFGLIIIRVL